MCFALQYRISISEADDIKREVVAKNNMVEVMNTHSYLVFFCFHWLIAQN